MNREKITIIDGSSYFFRAFFAIQRLTNSKGFPTNAIYGFINMLIRVLDVEKPTKLVIAFDTPKPSFRKEKYAEYKANRETPPEDLVKQIPHILRSVDCFNICRMEKPGFEADDVIGTLARLAEKEGYRVEIITGDKDLMQLVNDNVTLYDTMKDKRINTDGVVERFGVKPDQVVDMLALMGDASDNIPGVTGIGEKTAADLIREFGSIDNIYANLDKIKSPKRRETLEREKKEAYLSRELATIHFEVPLDFTWDSLSYRGPNPAKLKAFFEEFDFHNLMKRFDFKSEESVYAEGKYRTVGTEQDLRELVKTLSRASLLCLDTETTSLAIHSADLVGISLTATEGEAYYIPVGHHVPGAPHEKLAGQIDPDVVRKLLKPLLEDPKIPKLGQNLKYDTQILRRFGIEVKGVDCDTLLESYLIDPDQPHNLDSLSLRYLRHQMITYEDVTGRGKNQLNFAEVSIEKATQYSAEDVDVTLRLHQKLAPELRSKAMWQLYADVEIPLMSVLAEMEYAGILVDEAKLKKMGHDLEEELGTVQDKIYGLAGEPVNINSPKQLSQLLFTKLQLPVIRKTKTGLSTDESVLTELASKHEICRWILRFRELGKLRSTYVEGLLAEIHPVTHRVHTSYNQTVAATGRLSSSNPNLQNIPIGQEAKYDLRAVFLPAEGTELLSADYSQVELRLLADMSGDEALISAFTNNEDVHESTARNLFGAGAVTPEQRKIAKTINFGVIYGQTPYGLSQQLKISPSEAKVFIDTYFGKYTRVREFQKNLIEQARELGYTETKLGRRRYLPEIRSENRMRREMAERAAINAPIQGTAADMIKVAMIRLAKRFAAEKLQARMLLQVHDELVFEVPPAEKSQVEAMVREVMESALEVRIPLLVDMGWGKNWRECG